MTQFVPDPFIRFIEQAVSQVELPPKTEITDESRTNYRKALDRANEYRGDPRVLIEVVKILQSSNNLALFYTGIAYILFHASYQEGIKYSQTGLQVSRTWLLKAQEIGGELLESLVVQAFLEVHSRHLAEAFVCLERIQEIAPHDFYALTAWIDYYAVKGNGPQMIQAHHQALPYALSTSRRAYLQNRVGRYYLLFKMFDSAFAAYTDLIKLTPSDPWMWHNMSIVYVARGQILKAYRCNKIALHIMEFGNARKIQRHIQEIIAKRIIIGVVFLLIMAAWLNVI